MQKFSYLLGLELDGQLKELQQQTEDPVRYAEQAVHLTLLALEKLKLQLIQHRFKNRNQEIIFFKELKPRFTSKLIYYNEIYKIEVSRPNTHQKDILKYYSGELNKLKIFFRDHTDFHKYFRTGNRYLDHKYFLRGQHDIKLTVDSDYLQSDQRFSSSHDFKVARIIANDLLKVFLEEQMEKIVNPSYSHYSRKRESAMPTWTASKVALVELIYALHAEGVFDHGKANLQQVANLFSDMLEMDIKQVHRIFLEIRSRKTDRAKFLSALIAKLEVRMQEADER